LLAVERNETDAHVSGGSSAAFRARIAPMLKEGKAKIVLQMGMARDPEFPDVPTAIEIMPTAEGKQLFEIAFAEQVMGRPFVLPPGVPPDRVKVLRDAFDKALKDPELLADAKAQKMEIDPVTGAEINALLDRVYAAPPALAARLSAMAK
jgi:tripartite-type tricarboxylate transporter receptor subunit TctC